MRNNLIDVGMSVKFDNGVYLGTITAIQRIGAEMGDRDLITIGSISPSIGASTVVRTADGLTLISSGALKAGKFTRGPMRGPKDSD